MRSISFALSLPLLVACGEEIAQPPAHLPSNHALPHGTANSEPLERRSFTLPKRDGVAHEDETPLTVHFLGVQGFLLEHGDDKVLTAPLFTRANEATVSLGQDVIADTAAIDDGLAGDDLSGVRAILSGHAHYDHLMDVPRTMTHHAPDATLIGNLSARNIFAALAPDRPASCTSDPASDTIARERVIAVDDPLASAVDWQSCPDAKPDGVPLVGSWVQVPGANVRVYPVCGMHPDQFLFYHFAVGDVDDEKCELPAAATDWREGTTITYLVDFLDDAGAPVFRVYYQDAPSDGPIGHPPPEVLAEKEVDLAILCVGTYEQVRAHPEEITAALQPRVALSGHWEDFFGERDEPRAIPFMDLDAYVQRAEAMYPGAPDARFLVDGVASQTRHVLAQPGARFLLDPRAN